MIRDDLAEALDREIEHSGTTQAAGEFEPLLQIAATLRMLPSQEFKTQLRFDLASRAQSLDGAECADIPTTSEFAATPPEFMPSLEKWEFSILPADPRSFVFSFLSHAAVVVLIASGIWVGQRTIIKKQSLMSDITYVPLPAGDNAPHGGASGGDHSTIQVSRGTPPKFSDQQVVPPMIVARDPVAKLQVESTVQGPPLLRLPQSNQLGDLLASNATMPSNGSGGNSGMGNKYGSGIGNGEGPGFGSGTGGGCCDGAFTPGKGVTAPRAIYEPDPEYSEEARKAKYQGIVVLAIVVDPLGHPREVRVARSLGLGLDEKAIEAVQKWKFAPGVKNGIPVAVRVNIEVNFRLY
jgi:periplasmic protein TonB